MISQIVDEWLWLMPFSNRQFLEKHTHRLLVRRSQGDHSDFPLSLFIAGLECDNNPVGAGGLADVHQGHYAGDLVAVKCVRLFVNPPDRLLRAKQAVLAETMIWRSLKHEYILPLIGVDKSRFGGTVYMVSPWMKHGDINNFVSTHDPTPERVNVLLFEVAKALEYLHDRDVVHGDLRGGNILIDDDCHVRVADFGMSTFAGVSQPSNLGGTLRWMAPELFSTTPTINRTSAVDVYAFAMLCYEVYLRGHPFPALILDPQIWTGVINGERPERSLLISCGRDMSEDLWGLVIQCWASSPSSRPSASSICAKMPSFGRERPSSETSGFARGVMGQGRGESLPLSAAGGVSSPAEFRPQSTLSSSVRNFELDEDVTRTITAFDRRSIPSSGTRDSGTSPPPLSLPHESNPPPASHTMDRDDRHSRSLFGECISQSPPTTRDSAHNSSSSASTQSSQSTGPHPQFPEHQASDTDSTTATPTASSPTSPISPSGGQNYLWHLNEKCVHSGGKISIEWEYNHEGEPHMGVHHAMCFVKTHNSPRKLLGEGKASRKQAARELAARQVYQLIDWSRFSILPVSG
ncbi:hypothetical protein JAAARDRAFT_60004 [Jaapia argillacea MUCL 33604]|uniref:Protein kinase domain-containing protein n=1 Tax=Jaapia argillacea MUCL 33604 TaxID=933084 RepID=A0A067PL44_9AGAM|nr:hypothetical protein JAAARDRAFT_60004 [Jaapia argillacea MUCL 33604]